MFKKNTDIKSERLCIVVYGESGTGKTTLASTLPGRKVALILEPGGFLPLQDREDFDFYDCTVDRENRPLDKSLRIQKVEYFFTNILPTVDYDWVIVDSITELSQLFVESLKAKYPDKANSFVMWGEYSDGMQSILKAIRDCGRNVYMTALSSSEKDDVGARFIGIDCAGKIAQRIPSFFDEFFLLKIFNDDSGKPVRKLICGSYQNIVAKDRSGKCALIEEADLGSIVAKIKGVFDV